MVDWTAVLCDEPTERYLVQTSDDLLDWGDLAILYANPDGLLYALETFANAPERRFYRLRRIDYPDTL